MAHCLLLLNLHLPPPCRGRQRLHPRLHCGAQCQAHQPLLRHLQAHKCADMRDHCTAQPRAPPLTTHLPVQHVAHHLSWHTREQLLQQALHRALQNTHACTCDCCM
jgi:hypothetical protein